MKNGMTPLFDQQSLERWFDHFQNRAEERMLKLLQGAGEKFVEVARKSASFDDHSGNLRSSIGYVIAKDGKPGPVCEKLYNKLRAIQYGDEPDTYGWITIIE